MEKIKNPNYAKFLKEGVIDFITEEHIKRALENVKGKYVREGRALLIALYYTGARPNEILKLKPADFKKEASYIFIQVAGSKRGLPRPIVLQYKKELVRELYKFAISVYPNMLLFFHYRNNYKRERGGKTTIESTNLVYYHINKWFTGVIPHTIPPYYLRHNRFSKLAAAGVPLEQLRQLKGSRTHTSVLTYLHLSTESAKKTAKKIE